MAVFWTEQMLADLRGTESGYVLAARYGLSLGTVTGKRFRLRKAGTQIAEKAPRPSATKEELLARRRARRRKTPQPEGALAPPLPPPPPPIVVPPTPSPPQQPEKPPLVVRLAPVADPTLYRVVGRPAAPRRVNALHRGCQWPLEDKTADRPWRFCEEPSEVGRPYCTPHCAVAYGRRQAQDAIE
jgi:GcrA cell cycle regulator